MWWLWPHFKRFWAAAGTIAAGLLINYLYGLWGRQTVPSLHGLSSSLSGYWELGGGSLVVLAIVSMVAARAHRRHEAPHFIGEVRKPRKHWWSKPAPLPAPAPADTLIVGREDELAQLREWYASVLKGERRVVLVAGEAGIGKTAFVKAFLDSVENRDGVRIVRGQCVEQYGAGEPYMPILEALTQLGRSAEGPHLLELLHRLAPAWLAQLPALLTAEERARVQGEVLALTQQRMLREMAETLAALAAETPLILLLEDLHWSDAPTLDLIKAIARHTEPTRLLILGTYRPVEILAGDHPLRALNQELALHGRCHELRLRLLSELDVATYLELRFSDEDAKRFAGLAPAIHQRTEGNPLFIVNILDYLLAKGSLDPRKIEAPRNIRQMIERNLERLSPEEQAVLECASVAGADFSAAVIAAALERPVSEVEACCTRLSRHEQFVKAGGISEWPDGTRSAGCRFLHALYQEVLYERVPVAHRDALHSRIARREEAAFGDRAAEIASELAYHYSRCGNTPKAVEYLQKAAEQAEFRSAHRDAMQHYLAALRLLKSQPENPERDLQELNLWLKYLPVVGVTRDWTADDTGASLVRALELRERLGVNETAQKEQKVGLLRRMAEFHSGRAEHRVAHDFAVQMLDMAKSSDLEGWLQSAYTQLGTTLCYLGDLRAAHDYLDEALRCAHDDLRARIDCLSVDAEALWMLGYADQARRRTEESLALARNSAVPAAIALALTHAHMLSFFSGEYAKAIEFADEGIKLCTEKKIEFLQAALAWSRDNVRIFMGLDNDIEKPKRAFAIYHEVGTKLHLAPNCMFLARCCAILGKPDLGVEMIDRSIAATEETEQRNWEAESWRVKGELTIQEALQRNLSGASLGAAQDQAEQQIRKAIEIARRQSTKVFELRATVSLARLRADSQRREQTRVLLDEAYGWFTEGLDTRDLKEAKALLDELSVPVKAPAVTLNAG